MCIGGRLSGRCCFTSPVNIPIQQQEKIYPVPLTGVIVVARVNDFIAEVTIHQRYENVENNPIEAVYEFPLHEGASVSSFSAIVNGKKIIGKLKEKEEAKDEYEDAIASGNSAFLLEEVTTKTNVFQTSLGNIPPKQEVIISVVYVTELEFDQDKQLNLLIPTNPNAYPDGIVNPKFFVPTLGNTNFQVPYGLQLAVFLDMTSSIKQVNCTSHPVSVQLKSMQKAEVSLSKQDVSTPLLTDFELKIALAEPSKPIFKVQNNGQSNVAMLSLYPEFKISEYDEPITEMIFLIDRSGSMAGRKIDRARDTMQIFLRSLPLGTLFNIIGFGTKFTTLFPDGSKEYDDTTLNLASQHVSHIGANLGGTKLLPPLETAFSIPAKEGIPRQIFILTDGEVDNTQECIDYVRRHSSVSRVFTFGIGEASPELVLGVAKAGEGKAELIGNNDSIEDKVIAQLKRALQPALTDLRIDWGIEKVQQAPLHLPLLFNGGRVIVYGFLPKDFTAGTITLRGRAGSSDFACTIDANVERDTITGDFIPRLASRAMIRDLQENRSEMHNGGGALLKGFKESDVTNEIIRLSLLSGMLSKYTAFVAVDERSTSVQGTMQQRNVNKQLSKAVGRGAPMKKMSSPGYAAAPAYRTSSAAGSGGGISSSVNMSARERKGNAAGDVLSYLSSNAPTQKSKDKSKSVSRPGSAAPPPTSSSSTMSSLLNSIGGRAAPRSAQKSADAVVTQKKAIRVESTTSAPQRREKEGSRSLSHSSAAQEDSASASVAHSSDWTALSNFDSAPPAPRSSSLATTTTPTPTPTPTTTSTVTTTSGSSNAMKDIIMKQQAAGSFNSAVLPCVGVTLATLHANVPPALQGKDAATLDPILITALVCAYLALKYEDQRTQWELVVKKAITWLRREGAKIGLENVDWNEVGRSVVSGCNV